MSDFRRSGLLGFTTGFDPVEDYLLRKRLEDARRANTPPEMMPSGMGGGLLGVGRQGGMLLGGGDMTAPVSNQPAPRMPASVRVESLDPLAGYSAATSGAPLSMPVVGPQGIAKQGGSVYSPGLGSDRQSPEMPDAAKWALTPIGSLFPSTGRALDKWRRESEYVGALRSKDLRDQGRGDDARYEDLLGTLQNGGVSPNAIAMARYLGPGPGTDLLTGTTTKPAADRVPDIVNVYDRETNKTSGVTKATAALMMEANPNRFALAGALSADQGGSDGTETEREVKRLIEQDGLNDSDARDLAYGRARVVTDPVSGQAYKYNLRTGSSEPLKLNGGNNPSNPAPGGSNAPSAPVVQAPQVAPARSVPTLWEDATATGVVPALQAGASAISGQMGGPVASNVIASRQRLVNESQGLVRSLANNPRFPVGEMEALKKEISIQPDVFDSAGSMRARMVAIDQSLGRRYEDEVAAAENPSLPVETRQAAKQAANDIKNFRVKLGVPRNAPGNGGVRGGSPGVDAGGAPIVPGGSVGPMIEQMSKAQLSKLDPKQLSKEELAAAARRYEELGGE